MLKQIFIIQKSGVTLFEKKFEESIYEFQDMVTAFFSALIVFTEHSLGIGEIRELRCSSVKLLFDSSKDKQFFVVMIVDQYDEAVFFEGILEDIKDAFSEIYSKIDFKGRMGTFSAFEEVLDTLINDTIPEFIFQKEFRGIAK